MLTAVIAGVTIIKYRAAVFSAIMPIKGFKSHGILITKSHTEAKARVIPNFSISKGLRGARNDEYISCSRCVAETNNTLEV